MKLFLILTAIIGSLTAYSGTIKNDYYTDKYKLFQLKLEKKWQNNVFDYPGEKNSFTYFMDCKGHFFSVQAETYPKKLFLTFKNRLLDVLNVHIEEYVEVLSIEYKDVKLLHKQMVKIPGYGEGIFVFLEMTNMDPCLFSSKNKYDPFRGVLMYFNAPKLITLQYVDSCIEDDLNIKKEAFRKFIPNYINELIEISKKLST